MMRTVARTWCGIQTVIHSAKEGTYLTKAKSHYIRIRPSFHVLPSDFGLVISERCHKGHRSRGRGHLPASVLSSSGLNITEIVLPTSHS